MLGPPGGLPSSRLPANKVGGQRRRLTRPGPRLPAGVPRSATLPVLNTEGSGSAAFAGSGTAYDSTLSTTEEGGAVTGITYFTYQEGATSQEVAEGMLHFPPPAGVPVDHRRKFSHGGTSRDEASPAPTETSNNSSSTLTAEGKKHTDAKKKQKHGGLTINNPFRSTSKYNLEQTPLPPATPTKAAKLLGVTDTGAANDARPKTAQGNGSAYEVRPRTAKNDNSALDGVDEEEHHGRRELPQQSSMPYLGSPYSTSGNDPFDDIIVESDDEDDDDRKGHKSKSLLQSSKKMAKKMSVPNFRNFFTTRIENPSPVTNPASLSYASLRHELHANALGADRYAHVSSDQRSPERAQPQIAPRATTSHSEHGHGKKKKGRKQRSHVDRMAPVTEASRDDMRADYLDGEDDTWVDVIPEYARDSTTSGGPVLPPRNESLPPTYRGRFQLSSDELSAANDDTDDFEDEDEKPLLAKHKGKSVKKEEFQNQQAPAFNLRSPLQNVEDCLLDAAEKNIEVMRLREIMEKQSSEDHRAAHESPSESSSVTQSSSAYRMGQAQTSEEPWVAPAQVVAESLELLRKNAEAEKMLLDYEIDRLKTSHDKMKDDFAPYAKKKASEDDEKEESASIRSSIDLDEEPTTHAAKAMPMMRITPGMVKLVDIPPRKKKTT